VGCGVTDTDPETGIKSDPDDPADERFIVRLIERVTAAR
jgi:predicted helicase